MKKLFIIVLVAAIGITFSDLTFSQDKEKKETKTEVKTEVKKEEKAQSKTPFNSVCPVSGEEIDGDITATYEGKTYALCCKRCLKKFDKDPEKYIKNLSEDGKKFKKEK